MSEQMTEYQKNLVRMWESLRTEDKGTCFCHSVKCAQCPFNKIVCHDANKGTIFNAEKAIEIVNNWAKEHPIVTMVDKYKEVFGVEPKNICGSYLCPRYLGFKDVECESGAYCSHCSDKFWNSEYKKPAKEEVSE